MTIRLGKSAAGFQAISPGSTSELLFPPPLTQLEAYSPQKEPDACVRASRTGGGFRWAEHALSDLLDDLGTDPVEAALGALALLEEEVMPIW